MKKVYIVTSGDYSDYTIEAAFSTEEKANEFIQQHGSDYRLEVHDVDEEVKKETKLWEVSMYYEDFTLKKCSIAWEDLYIADTFRVLDDCFGKKVLYQYIETDSMDRAIKIASERIAQIKANEHLLYANAFIKVSKPRLGFSWDEYPTVVYKSGNIIDYQ